MPSTPPAPARNRPPGVLTDALPAGAVTSVLVVLAGAAVIGLCAQVSIPLPGTPVPLTLQTFAVLLVSAALGPRRAVAATAGYVAAGFAGLNWFSPGAGPAATGYLLGFVGCALLVGTLARRGMDRRFGRTVALLAAGDLIILVSGATGLALVLHVGPVPAVIVGVLPFLLGDAVKVLAAAALLPAAWRVVGAR